MAHVSSGRVLSVFNVVPLPGLRNRRILAALTQAQLADLAGISRLSITRLEARAGSATPQTVRRLADALKCEPRDLIQPEA